MIETNDFAGAVTEMQRYGGQTPLISSDKTTAVFALSAGFLLKVQLASKSDWAITWWPARDRKHT